MFSLRAHERSHPPWERFRTTTALLIFPVWVKRCEIEDLSSVLSLSDRSHISKQDSDQMSRAEKNSKTIPDEHKDRVVRFFQAKKCNAVHVPVNSKYDNFYRALSTSAFSIMCGVNLGYGASSSALKDVPASSRQDRAALVMAAMQKHSTPSHYVQLALASHLRAYCCRAVVASRGGARRLPLEEEDIVPSEKGRAAKTWDWVEQILLSEACNRTNEAVSVHPQGLFEYLAHWYGVMAAQSLVDADIPSETLKKKMAGMRVLLRGVTVDGEGEGAPGMDEDVRRVYEVVEGGLFEGSSWPDSPRLLDLWKRAADVVSQVIKLVGFPAGLCVVHPYPKSKFELYGPNTTWCSKQDRRRYSIKEEDRVSEDKLAMMPLPSDVVDDASDINVWLPLLGLSAGKERTRDITSNRAVCVTAYDSSAESENEAAAWGKALFKLSDETPSAASGGGGAGGRTGQLAYASVIGIEKSASFEAPMHRTAVRATIETLISAGITETEELQTRCSAAFPSDTEEFRDTEIALAYSSLAASRERQKKKEKEVGRGDRSEASKQRRVSARSVDESEALIDGSTDDDEEEEEEEEEVQVSHRRKPKKDAITHEATEKIIRGALSEIEAVVTSTKTSRSDGAKAGPGAGETFSKSIKLRPKSPVPISTRPRSVNQRGVGGGEETRPSASQMPWPSDFLKPESEIFASKPQVDTSFEPEMNVPTLTALDRLSDLKGDDVRSLDSFCSKICVFTTMDTMTPYFGIASKDGMRVLMELMLIDAKRTNILRITRPRGLSYGVAVPYSNVSLAEPSTIKGITLLPEQVTCICIGSHPQIAKACELGAKALRAKEILLELISFSKSSTVDDHFMGPGYTAQLEELKGMLESHSCPTFRRQNSSEGYRIAILDRVWRKSDVESSCQELERCMSNLFAVIAVDEEGHDYPLIFRSSSPEFDFSRRGKIVQESHLRNRQIKHLITEGSSKGSYDVEIHDVIALSEYDGVYRVPTKASVHTSVEIGTIGRPHRRTSPKYFFGLTRFQREVVLATANPVIFENLRNLEG